MQSVINWISFITNPTWDLWGPNGSPFFFINIMTKWTKEQLIEGSLSLVRMKSKLAMIEKKVKDKGIRMTFSDRLKFNKIYSPLKKKITDMENEFLLNVAGNGVEGEENAEPPPTNKEKQILKVTV